MIRESLTAKLALSENLEEMKNQALSIREIFQAENSNVKLQESFCAEGESKSC